MSPKKSFIHWFRRDLRLHDMPAISAALKEYPVFHPVYIFDEDDLQSDKISYNRVRYILEALREIDAQLKQHNGRLLVLRGKPAVVLSSLVEGWGVGCLSYEEDVLPPWKTTEAEVLRMCAEKGVRVLTRPSRTLWRPQDILRANGGQPPTTYQLLCQAIELLGPPDKPEPELQLSEAAFETEDGIANGIDWTPEDLGFQMESPLQKNKVYCGGEREALRHLGARLRVEAAFLEDGLCMPNQAKPDLLGPPMSMSAALAHGCLSVRKFYWSLYDLVDSAALYTPDSLMGQLLWREYFYAMCMDNPHFGSMRDNPVCLNIPWECDGELLRRWREGRTGYPFVDAAMRQLVREGWLHHVARNAVACFLTRGDLWLSWEEGFKVFMQYLLDADFPVCAGNWMWVSSSAFENILQCPVCVSPVAYGRHFEPTGDYIRKFVPELSRFPTQFIYEPWRAPPSVQEAAGCVVGVDYPSPCVEHEGAGARNAARMAAVKSTFSAAPVHCAPSDPSEARIFMWLPSDTCIQNLS